MAAVTVVAADVRPTGGFPLMVRRLNAGDTITPGMAVYIASDGDIEPADADAEESSLPIGIAISDGTGAVSFAAGTRVDVVVYGPVTGFSGMTPGVPVFVSATAGAVDETAPSASGDFVNAIGYAESATVLFVKPHFADLTAIPE